MPKGIFKRKPFTKEHRKNIGLSKMGNSFTIGRKCSQNTKNKMRNAAKIRWASDDYRIRMSKAHIGNPGYWTGKKRNMSKEWKDKIKASLPRGENHHNWNGGKSTQKAGYVLIKNPHHPYAHKSGYVFKHRLVMEKHIGRYLRPEEIVHHINNIHGDNRIKNLKLFSDIGEHAKHHAKKRVKKGFQGFFN